MDVTIDLNSDLGEQLDASLDELIMPFISSCNIACGGHAGDRDSILRTIELAQKHEVNIGIHPSFPDRENFGRAIMQMTDQSLTDALLGQMGSFKELARESGAFIQHVKPHGALYNLAAANPDYARIITKTVQEIDPTLRLVGLAHSTSEKVAKESHLAFVGEAFADRRYVDSKRLKSRDLPGAVLENEAAVLSQVEHLVFQKAVETDEGRVKIEAQTICLHSDTKGAVLLAKSIHEFIVDKGGQVTSI